jgi:parallel beta-helix repeat protein
VKGIILDTSTLCFVENNIFDGNANDLYISDSNEVTINNNLFQNYTVNGLFIRLSAEVSIIDNICNNGSGEGGMFIASNPGQICLRNNTCNNNLGYGIFILGTPNSCIFNNTCNFNELAGIWLFYDSINCSLINNTCNSNYYGIQLNSASENQIQNNFCCENLYGIYLKEHSYNNLIKNNVFQNNTGFGVYITASTNEFNIIHHNMFLFNNLGGISQGYDSGYGNLWYDPVKHQGNYWSDYSGSGYYYIDGEAQAVDIYPFGYTLQSSTHLLSLFIVPIIFFIPLILNIKSRAKK